jgi:hypothetical protein
LILFRFFTVAGIINQHVESAGSIPVHADRFAGWMNQRQLLVIAYLHEENRVLREQLGGRRLRLNDDQCRRLAARAKGLGRRVLAEMATVVTPETLLAWHAS